MNNKDINKYANLIFEQELIIQNSKDVNEIKNAQKQIMKYGYILEKDLDALLKINEILESKLK